MPSYPRTRDLLRQLFDTAVADAYPDEDLARHLPDLSTGRVIVVGAGKAGASMAQALEPALGNISDSLIIVPYGHMKLCASTRIMEAAHPVPDATGQAAASRILELARALGEGDLLICLLSGGGSALLNLPLPGLTLEGKREVTRALLASGASIHEINTVRKHLSQIKGGRLAKAAFPARTLTLAISDVPGDDPSTIASGPTVGDATTRHDAGKILNKYAIQTAGAVEAVLSSELAETPAPDDPALARSEFFITATAAQALLTAANRASAAGFDVTNLGDAVEGFAHELAEAHARLFDEMIEQQGAKVRAMLISGGEATVKITGSGRGGPNQEYLLALAIALEGKADTFGIACDTDGIDGASEAAGAIITPDTLRRADQLGMDPEAYLSNNDAGTFFDRLGDRIVTGPTCTNVNDFRVIAHIPEAG